MHLLYWLVVFLGLALLLDGYGSLRVPVSAQTLIKTLGAVVFLVLGAALVLIGALLLTSWGW